MEERTYSTFPGHPPTFRSYRRRETKRRGVALRKLHTERREISRAVASARSPQGAAPEAFDLWLASVTAIEDYRRRPSLTSRQRVIDAHIAWLRRFSPRRAEEDGAVFAQFVQRWWAA